MYDADARRAALQPPILKLDGQTHEGRVLSLDDGDKLAPGFAALRQGQLDVAGVKQLTVDVFKAMGWNEELAKEAFAKMPITLIGEMLGDFSGALLGAREKATEPAPAPTSASAG
jgi:hypothetical protein